MGQWKPNLEHSGNCQQKQNEQRFVISAGRLSLKQKITFHRLDLAFADSVLRSFQ